MMRLRPRKKSVNFAEDSDDGEESTESARGVPTAPTEQCVPLISPEPFVVSIPLNRTLSEKGFAEVTFDMLEMYSHNRSTLIGWAKNGRHFFVKGKEEGISSALQPFFAHGNFPSFRRQLCAYNFKRNTKKGSLFGYWFHPNFHRKSSKADLEKIQGSRRRRPAAPSQSTVKAKGSKKQRRNRIATTKQSSLIHPALKDDDSDNWTQMVNSEVHMASDGLGADEPYPGAHILSHLLIANPEDVITPGGLNSHATHRSSTCSRTAATTGEMSAERGLENRGLYDKQEMRVSTSVSTVFPDFISFTPMKSSNRKMSTQHGLGSAGLHFMDEDFHGDGLQGSENISPGDVLCPGLQPSPSGEDMFAGSSKDLSRKCLQSLDINSASTAFHSPQHQETSSAKMDLPSPFLFSFSDDMLANNAVTNSDYR